MPPEAPDIEKLLERMQGMAAPDTPVKSFQRDNRDLFAIRGWARTATIELISAILTLPELHANGVRIDWLLRLVASHARGRKPPTQYELKRALNSGLARARITHLEDPSEELFCEQIVTQRGNFTVFPGQWVTPTAYTQSLIKGFETLPSGGPSERAIDSCYELLRLSSALASRCGFPPMLAGGGTPFETIDLPAFSDLKTLAKRVVFTATDLAQLAIDTDKLKPFVMQEEHFEFVSMKEPGNSALEFFPLVDRGDGIIIASPQNLTTAIRALLIDVALKGGMGTTLERNMLLAQEAFAEEGGFWPLHELKLSAPDRFGIRQSICQYEPGRYLQVVQFSCGFDGFPESAFSGMREASPAAAKRLGEHIEKFWEFGDGREDRRSLTTIMLMGGWGSPLGAIPKFDHAKAPDDWEYLPLSFADCAVFGVAENSKFNDIMRMLKQGRLLEADGFEFINPSGIINEFGYWRLTEGNFIPEHMLDIKPPCTLMMGVNDLLEPREEAASRRGYRALPHPDGYKAVQRLQWGKGGSLRPIFACRADLERSRLTGAIEREGRTWWIEAPPTAEESRDRRYQVWNAVLQWLDSVYVGMVAKWPESFPAAVARVELTSKDGFRFERVNPRDFGTSDLQESVVTTFGPIGGRVEVSREWVLHLGIVQNDAEIELIASVLEALSRASSKPLSREDVRGAVLETVGTRDWRWLHAREAITVQDRLTVSRSLEPFEEIPFSAHALAKCNSVWRFRDRSEGSAINGEEECKEFLQRYRESILASIIAEVRKFNRISLVTACLSRYQSARVEQGRWRSTIRALRAISGSAADDTAFNRQNEINAVQRSAKVIAEIAACESPISGGLVPGTSELDDILAKSLFIFGNGNLSAGIKAGILRPEIRISPAGDLLSERETFNAILRPTAEWSNRKALDQASEAYGKTREDEPQREGLSWDAELRDVIFAEYGVSAEVFVDTQFAVLKLAEDQDKGILIMRRKELAAAIAASDPIQDADPLPLVERLTLPCRKAWDDLTGRKPYDFDIGKFDRPWSLINRPLLALDQDDDPLLAISPMMLSDSVFYCAGGLMEGLLNNDFWQSAKAKQYAGAQGDRVGKEFEAELAKRLTDAGVDATARCKLSTVLNEKVSNEIGDVDVFVVSSDRKRVWVLEAKNLKLCRTENEAALRLSEYRGRMIDKCDGKQKPDKLLKHLRRVNYLRARTKALAKQLKLPGEPEVHGLIVVDAPQPMNLGLTATTPDARTVLADEIEAFNF